MRQISQSLRSIYDEGEDTCVEFILHKLEEFKEVRCKRQGASDSEINDEFKQICLSALQFEADHFERKVDELQLSVDELQLSKVPVKDDPQGAADRSAKLGKILLKKALIESLRQFVKCDFSVGQSSAVMQSSKA